jgi:SHS2 domain-containing protein
LRKMNQAAGQPGLGDRGHRSVPHTADLRIEAWGPTREDCIAGAIQGLVESFADVWGTGHQRTAKHHLTARSDADLLAAAVEEVIYRLDTEGEIPVSVHVSRAAAGGIDLTLLTVDAGGVEITGAAPKAASLSGLTCAPSRAGQWSCAVTIDVLPSARPLRGKRGRSAPVSL